MARYQVRTLVNDDFDALMALEREVFGSKGEEVLGPYYVRLCCEFYADTCFAVIAEGRIVGYMLSFLRGREVHCTTLAVVPEFHGTRAVHQLLRAFIQTVGERVDTCWFTVSEENGAARALHAWLGATELEVRRGYYGPGDDRIVSRIDRDSFERLRAKFERLGLVTPTSRPLPNVA